jgi:hypothetical protein
MTIAARRRLTRLRNRGAHWIAFVGITGLALIVAVYWSGGIR